MLWLWKCFPAHVFQSVCAWFLKWSTEAKGPSILPNRKKTGILVYGCVLTLYSSKTHQFCSYHHLHFNHSEELEVRRFIVVLTSLSPWCNMPIVASFVTSTVTMATGSYREVVVTLISKLWKETRPLTMQLWWSHRHWKYVRIEIFWVLTLCCFKPGHVRRLFSEQTKNKNNGMFSSNICHLCQCLLTGLLHFSMF